MSYLVLIANTSWIGKSHHDLRQKIRQKASSHDHGPVPSVRRIAQAGRDATWSVHFVIACVPQLGDSVAVALSRSHLDLGSHYPVCEILPRCARSAEPIKIECAFVVIDESDYATLVASGRRVLVMKRSNRDREP